MLIIGGAKGGRIYGKGNKENLQGLHLHEYNLLAFITPSVTTLQQPEPLPTAKKFGQELMRMFWLD